MEEERKFNPLAIMVNPRGFMRKTMNDRKHSVWWVAWIFGLIWGLSKANDFGLGLHFPLAWILLGIAVLAIPIGYLIFFLASIFLHWTGKILKGQGTHHQLFLAYAWSKIPLVFVLIAWIGLIIIYKEVTFTSQVFNRDVVPVAVLWLFGGISIFWVWSAVIGFHAVGEVQKFSAWIAIWNLLFTWVCLSIVDFIVMWAIVKFGLVEAITKLNMAFMVY